MQTTTPRGRLLATLLLPAWIAAQEPVGGPPWWNVTDNDTVSLFWSFDNAGAPLVPDLANVPVWYSTPPAGITLTGPVAWIGALNGHTGVMGFTGAGTGTLADVIDNDPRPNWLKVFFFQFDEFETASGSLKAAIRQDLSKYKRVNVKEETVPIGNGWSRTTVQADLLPQPADEAIDFSYTETALGSVAIDNLFVNSKCVKPPPDEKGDALGDVDATFGPLGLDLQAANVTGNTGCRCAAVTEDQFGVRTIWVAGTAPTAAAAHPLFRLDSTGAPIAPSIALPTTTQGPLGFTDLAVRRVSAAQSFVAGIRDERASGGQLEILEVNATTGAVSAPIVLQLAGLALPPPPHAFGLLFFAPGDNGNGTYWITDNQSVVGLAGSAHEFRRNGTRVPATPTRNLINRLPAQTVGSGYDALRGMFYWFSAEPQLQPDGTTTRVNGFVQSAYDFQPTGVRFFGDTRIPDPNGPGGIALGFDVYRRNNGDFRAVCVVQVQGRSRLYELKGPFEFGWNFDGRMGMRGDPPMRGATNFQVTLRGVPTATGAVLLAGFSNQLSGATPLPFSLAFVGLDESNISVDPTMSSAFQPVVNGSCAFTVPMLPPGFGPNHLPLFLQWVVFDPAAPNGIATSQAGKTVIY